MVTWYLLTWVLSVQWKSTMKTDNRGRADLPHWLFWTTGAADHEQTRAAHRPAGGLVIMAPLSIRDRLSGKTTRIDSTTYCTLRLAWRCKWTDLNTNIKINFIAKLFCLFMQWLGSQNSLEMAGLVKLHNNILARFFGNLNMLLFHWLMQLGCLPCPRMSRKWSRRGKIA